MSGKAGKDGAAEVGGKGSEAVFYSCVPRAKDFAAAIENRGVAVVDDVAISTFTVVSGKEVEDIEGGAESSVACGFVQVG